MARSGVSRYGSGSKKAGRNAKKNERLHRRGHWRMVICPYEDRK